MMLARYFDQYIPKAIRQSGSREELLRARVLAALYLTNSVIAGFILLLFIFTKLLTNTDLTVGFIALGIAIPFLFFQILYFYHSNNTAISAIIFSMTFFGCTLAAVIMTGGWTSPLLLLFLCSPAISFLVGGRKEGYYMAAISSLSASGLWFIDSLGIDLFQVIRPEHMEMVKFGIWTISISLLGSCMAVYESILTRLIKQNQ